MEMKKINSGKLRAVGYDARARMLHVQLDDGSTLQYAGVGEDTWRRFSNSGRSGASIATTSKKNSRRSAFPQAPLWATTLSMSYSGKPDNRRLGGRLLSRHVGDSLSCGDAMIYVRLNRIFDLGS